MVLAMPIIPILFTVALTHSKTMQTYSETLRPQFHFTAKANWLNDPNGLVFYKGTYHLFFQHNPKGTEWGNMTWGHATSPDLVHWTQQANAIDPDSLGTIFSGSAVVDWNNTSGFKNGIDAPLVAIYACAGDTSPESKGKPYTQCLAYSSNAGKTWTKYGQNPVLNQIASGNRDPKVIWYEPLKEWVMALYFEGNDFGLFRSKDLKSWNLTQRFNFDGAGECPDFFEIPVEGSNEKKWVYTSASGRYLVGSFDGTKFTPEQLPQNMDHGTNYYAVQTYSDIPKKDGRRIQIAWMNGGRYPGMPFNQQMSFPCRLTLHKSGTEYRIYREPIKEIKALYGEKVEAGKAMLGENNNPVSLPAGEYDLSLDVDVRQAKTIELKINGTAVNYDVIGQAIHFADRSVLLPLQKGHLVLRALVDRTSIELFGNDGAFSFTACYLPDSTHSGISVTAHGGDAQLVRLRANRLNSAWNAK